MADEKRKEKAVELLNKVDLSGLTLEDVQKIENGHLQMVIQHLLESEGVNLSDPGHQNYGAHGNYGAHANHNNIALFLRDDERMKE